MKSSVFAFLVFVVLFSSCDEVPPNIDFSVPYKTKDTSYIATTVPAAQHKAVLIEDITGVRCINCPQAAEEAKKIVDTKTEDSVVVMGLYTKHMVTLTTPWSGYPDLRSDLSTSIVDFLGVPGDLPKGYVDRSIFAPLTERFVQYKSWGLYTDQRLKLTTPVNINLSSKVSGRNANITLQFVYTKSVASTHKYSLYLLEDGIVSYQLGATPDPAKYIHNHVLRSAFGSEVGNPINATLVPGRTIEKILDYEVPAQYDIDKLRLVCVITDGTTNEVVNVREIHLK